MRPVDQPEVFLIAEPQINVRGMLRYLKAVGGEAWIRRISERTDLPVAYWLEDGPPVSSTGLGIPAAEGLIEFMGRLCYKSWEPGLNANVTKIREDRGEYLTNVLRSGHGSILEHAWFSFAIHNCSRVLTAELNRHRAGTAISEQSLRYVRLDDLSFRLPPTLSAPAQETMREGVEVVEDLITALIAMEITDDMAFAQKKEITSAIRRIAPLGLATEEGWSANIRAIRHVIEMRSDPAAEEEIRVFAYQLYQIMSERCPLLFADYDEVAHEHLDTPYRKV